MDEKKDIIAQAGMELTDEELDGVAGGGKTSNPICKNCQKPFFTNAMMGEVFCPDCRSKMMQVNKKATFQFCDIFYQ